MRLDNFVPERGSAVTMVILLELLGFLFTRDLWFLTRTTYHHHLHLMVVVPRCGIPIAIDVVVITFVVAAAVADAVVLLRHAAQCLRRLVSLQCSCLLLRLLLLPHGR